MPDPQAIPTLTDVAIAGAGVAGCATAIALKRFVPELDVCLIDREASGEHDTTDESRYRRHIQPRIGETLPPAVVVPMQQLGIWPRFRRSGALASAGIQSVWGAKQAHVNEHIYSPHGNGWHLDRRQFDAMLQTIALEHGVRRLTPMAVTGLRRERDQWRLQLHQTGETGHTNTLQAAFVVDTTGRNASLARLLGANRQRHDRLVGLYRFYHPARSGRLPSDQSRGDSSTVIESRAQGYWYGARLPHGRLVVALMTDADLARAGGYADPGCFDRALARTELISCRVAGMRASGDPVITAAHTQCLDTLCGRGWLAAGDAAFTYDPLSSLGIFKALRQSLLASYAIRDAFSGKDRELRKYARVCRDEFERYLHKRRNVYADETRFTHHPFWQRRLAA